MNRIRVSEHPEFTRAFRASCVRAPRGHRSGQRLAVRAEYPKGHAQNPLTDADVVIKFRALSGDVLSASGPAPRSTRSGACPTPSASVRCWTSSRSRADAAGRHWPRPAPASVASRGDWPHTGPALESNTSPVTIEERKSMARFVPIPRNAAAIAFCFAVVLV